MAKGGIPVKRFLCALLCAALLTVPVWAEEEEEHIVPDDIAAATVVVEGEEHSVSVVVLAGKYYYRLRDVAFALKGSPWAVDVTWDRQVYITHGGTYTAQALEPETDQGAYMEAPQIFIVNGAETTVNALMLHDHNYLPVRCMNKALGTQAQEVDGKLVFSAAENGD